MSVLANPPKPKAKAVTKALRPYEPVKPILLDRYNYLNDPLLIDQDNFSVYTQTIANYIDNKNRQRDFVVSQVIANKQDKHIPQIDYLTCIKQLIRDKKLPHDYNRRLVLRQLAQGINFTNDTLEQHNIFFIDQAPSDFIRKQPEYRQPNSPFDFVLIDTDYWQNYANMRKFYEDLAAKPSCSYAKDGKNLIRPRDTAITYPYIAPYHPQVTGAMIFDVDCMDRNGAWAFELWKEYNLPPPNIIIKNPYKESYQYIYLLRDPVCNWGEISKKFIYLFDLIYENIRLTFQADKSFNGDRMKNPFSSAHDVYVSGAEPYTLYDLADKADLPDTQQQKAIEKKNRYKKQVTINPDGYMGRNCAIFDTIRHLGYANAHLGYDALYYYLLSECEQYNKDNYSSDPLPQRELCNIAKSITRFCKSERFRSTPEQKQKRSLFARQNAIKANNAGACNKGGIARSATYEHNRLVANEMHQQGMSIRKIATKLNVSKTSVQKWIKV